MFTTRKIQNLYKNVYKLHNNVNFAMLLHNTELAKYLSFSKFRISKICCSNHRLEKKIIKFKVFYKLDFFAYFIIIISYWLVMKTSFMIFKLDLSFKKILGLCCLSIISKNSKNH